MATTGTKRGPKSARKSTSRSKRTSSKKREAPAAANRADEPPAPGTPSGSGKSSKGGKKSKGDKIVRDTFNMPAKEYDRIAALKKRCLSLGMPMKKSELLRAGIATLDKMADDRLKDVVSRVAKAKTGRAAGEKQDRKAKRAE